MLFVNIISSSGGGGGGGGGHCSGMLSELQHLNSTGISQKLKSQCGGIEVFVKHKVRWPHDYVLAGSNKECEWRMCQLQKQAKGKKTSKPGCRFNISLLCFFSACLVDN